MPGKHKASDQLRYLTGNVVPSYSIGGAQAYGGNTGQGAGSAYSGASNQMTSASMNTPSGYATTGSGTGSNTGGGTGIGGFAQAQGYNTGTGAPVHAYDRSAGKWVTIGINTARNNSYRYSSTGPGGTRYGGAPSAAPSAPSSVRQPVQQPEQWMYSPRFRYPYPKPTMMYNMLSADAAQLPSTLGRPITFGPASKAIIGPGGIRPGTDDNPTYGRWRDSSLNQGSVPQSYQSPYQGFPAPSRERSYDSPIGPNRPGAR